MPGDMSERRSFERFPLELNVEIYHMDNGPKEFVETAKLLDISGGGAQFVSFSPEKYSIGQRLFIAIVLPETAAPQPSMQGKATVVWIGEPSAEDAGVGIGVCMDDLLVLSHILIGSGDDA